jgi:hypothetical protein
MTQFEPMKFKGKRVLDDQEVTGYFFVWHRYSKEIPIIGDGVRNGAVMGFEVYPETVEPLRSEDA